MSLSLPFDVMEKRRGKKRKEKGIVHWLQGKTKKKVEEKKKRIDLDEKKKRKKDAAGLRKKSEKKGIEKRFWPGWKIGSKITRSLGKKKDKETKLGRLRKKMVPKKNEKKEKRIHRNFAN